MDWLQILQALLSLIFVIGLLFLTLWLFKYCESKGFKNRLTRCLDKETRIKILELKRIDAKNSLVLFHCDSKEFLILLNSTQNTVISENNTNTEETNYD